MNGSIGIEKYSGQEREKYDLFVASEFYKLTRHLPKFYVTPQCQCSSLIFPCFFPTIPHFRSPLLLLPLFCPGYITLLHQYFSSEIFEFGYRNFVLMYAEAKEPRMTNQNVVASDEKSVISVSWITVSLANSPLLTLPPVLSVTRKLRRKLETNNRTPKISACWVDSMRASSPTRVSSSTASLSETDEHASWIVGSVSPFSNSGLLSSPF